MMSVSVLLDRKKNTGKASLWQLSKLSHRSQFGSFLGESVYSATICRPLWFVLKPPPPPTKNTHPVWVYFGGYYGVTQHEASSERVVAWYQLSLSSTLVQGGYHHIRYTSAEFIFRYILLNESWAKLGGFRTTSAIACAELNEVCSVSTSLYVIRLIHSYYTILYYIEFFFYWIH